MKKVIIGFSHAETAFSKLIMFATRSKISHTYVKLYFGGIDETVMFQASGLRVNAMNESVFDTFETIVDEVEFFLKDEDFRVGEKFLISQLGKPYSVKQIFGFTWILMNRALGRKVKNPYADGDHAYVCVELVARYLGIAGAEDMTPEDLHKVIRSRLPLQP